VFTNCRTYLRCITPSLVLSVPLARTVLAQSAGSASKVLTLEEAVDFALKNYPAVRASLERVNAPQAGVGLARTNYLPRADILWQWNRATDNNITELLLPQSIISPIAGPVRTYPTSQLHGAVLRDFFFPGRLHSVF
jgi:outer membrane protein TolC